MMSNNAGSKLLVVIFSILSMFNPIETIIIPPKADISVIIYSEK